MTLTDFFKILDEEYPYIEYGAVENHSVDQGLLFGHHVIEIRLIVRTGLILEYDAVKKFYTKDDAKKKKKKEGLKCGTADKNKDGINEEVEECNKQSTNDVGKTE